MAEMASKKWSSMVREKGIYRIWEEERCLFIENKSYMRLRRDITSETITQQRSETEKSIKAT